MNLDSIIKKIAALTIDRPMFLHFDSIGLLYLGGSKEARLEAFDKILNGVAEMGGNIILPSFTYSFCRNEMFDVGTTPTTLGEAHEYLRLRNPTLRTSDGIFSYLIFGSHPVLKPYLKHMDSYESFGAKSLMASVLELNGLIGSIGGVLCSTTEIHHIEKKLKVEYRYDKVFVGTVRAKGGFCYQQKTKFFCRDLSFYQRTLLGSDLRRLYQDLEAGGKVKEVNIDNDFLLDFVSYSDVHDVAKAGIRKNPHYLLSKREGMFGS